MKENRLTTPVVPAPEASGNNKPNERRYELKAPIVITWSRGEREHELGDVVIGRSPGADIVLDDPLVSRNHARIAVSDEGGILIEDLRSANGVFVNGTRITQYSARLNEGDRILIGTTEFSLFSGRESGTLPIRRKAMPEPAALARPVPGPTPLARISRTRAAASAEPPAMIHTERSTVLGMLARLANSLVASGRTAEAVELIAEHLRRIMLGASAGLPIPDDVLHEAGHHALDLFQKTRQVSWIEYVIEIHLAARKVPNSRNLSALRAAVENADAAINPGALPYFVESLSAGFDAMSAEERGRLAELRSFAGSRRLA